VKPGTGRFVLLSARPPGANHVEAEFWSPEVAALAVGLSSAAIEGVQMPTEVRIYTMKPGKLDDFIEVFTNNIMPTSAAFGIRIHAAWRNEAENEFVWVRSYDDDATLARYSDSPERAQYTPKTQACIDSMKVRTVESVVGDLSVANS
jgi:quinol monooxygenase YgiN